MIRRRHGRTWAQRISVRPDGDLEVVEGPTVKLGCSSKCLPKAETLREGSSQLALVLSKPFKGIFRCL